MKNKKLNFSKLAATSMLLLVNVAMAGMLQQPIQAMTGAVPPNVMFTLDDSGSMAWGCVPDSLCVDGSKDALTTPWKYLSDDWKSVTYKVRECQTESNGVCTKYYTFNERTRSTVNPLYYNPAIRYLPWLKADGTRYPEYPATAARVEPEKSNSTDVKNLVLLQKIGINWCKSVTNCGSWSEQDVYPAQYFKLTPGASITNPDSYTKVEIKSGQTYPKSAARTDCVTTPSVLTPSQCSYEEEAQNFSNWYSYHRSRIRVAIAGTAESFYAIPGVYRVGYGRINKSSSTDIDGLSISTIEKGVRPFVAGSSGNKDSFYTWLFKQKPDSGTPLRRAMDDVGKYYSYTANKGPWGEEPGVNNTVPQLSCRRSFHMLMTDGMWNGSSASIGGDVDNKSGLAISGPNSQSYKYTPAAPYGDATENTLADVAMYYWNKDLNPNLENGITASASNPAFWQHMVNYTISFGALGTLNPATDLPLLTSGAKTWPVAGDNKAENIDDLWHAAVNSRGKYLSASNTDEYSNALKGIIDDIAAVNDSQAGVAVSAKTLSATTLTRKYEAEFSSARWSGDVKAINLTATGADNGTAVWNAAANFPAHGSRNIFTYNKNAVGTKGINFTWTSLPDAMKTTVFGSTSGGENLINYLRGDRAGEVGAYRLRASVLGDIINSTPILIKDQADGQYGFLPTSTAQSTYRRFLVAKKQRNAQLFVGANDGMLHAFSEVDGAETFAFVPESILGKVKKLSTLNYTHEYFVDGPLSEADIYDGSLSKWRNVVLGGTGAGAKSLFAVNVPVVSYPSNATAVPAALSVANSAPGAADILWNISSADTDFSELGYVLQPLEHGVMRDGTWVVIVGNGYESTAKKAQLFIINALTGALVKKLDTGVGSAGTPNGLGGVRVVRNDKKQIVAAYAGDLQGNLWKFDLSSDTPTNWVVAFGNNPLYKTAVIEPITAAPTYTLHPSGGVMVLFGTGKLYEIGDEATTTQRALYGVWDMVKLGATSTDAATRITVPETIVAQALSSTALTGTTGTFYGLTVTPVDYEVKSVTETRPAYMTKRGWRLPLTVGSGQRLIDNPEMAGGLAFMQTVTPSSTQAACTSSSVTRYGFLLDPFMKGAEQATFDTNADGVFTSTDQVTVSGVLLVGSGPATMVREFGKNKFRMTQARTGLNQNSLAQGGANLAKRYWRQVVAQPN